MSVSAINWAYKQVISRSSAKFVLVTMANLVRHDDDQWQVFAAVDYLAKETELNRKTVIEALKFLREAGYLIDTGRTAGDNRCIPIYRLAEPKPSAQPTGHNTATDTGNQTVYKAPSNAGSPGKRLGSSWSLPPEWRVWARQQRHWDDNRIDAVAAIFHAYWTSNNRPEAHKPDWFAAWRLWVLKEHEHLPPSEPKTTESDPKGPSTDYASIGAQIRASLEAMEAGKTSTENTFDPEIIDVEMVWTEEEKSGYAQKRDDPLFPPAGTKNGTTTSPESGTTTSPKNGTQ